MSIKQLLKKNIDYRVPGTIAWKMRRKRMKVFNEWLEETIFKEIESGGVKAGTTRIIDIGGVPEYWKYLGFERLNDVRITSLNIEMKDVPEELNHIIEAVRGNAVDMKEYDDYSFDLAFSNSVIEHVGDYSSQKKMAKEMNRVARHGYLQTPNKYFFMEPHFLFPFFQFLPHTIREQLVLRFQMGYFKKATTREEARRIVDDVHLLSYKQLKELFPNASIHKERWMGMTKSFVLRW